MSSTHLPLYAQVENVIMERIANGSLPAGSRLPSEDSLVQEYAVSRTTIRAAIQSLVQLVAKGNDGSRLRSILQGGCLAFLSLVQRPALGGPKSLSGCFAYIKPEKSKRYETENHRLQTYRR